MNEKQEMMVSSFIVNDYGRRGINGLEDDGIVDEGLQAESTRLRGGGRDGEIASIYKLSNRFAQLSRRLVKPLFQQT